MKIINTVQCAIMFLSFTFFVHKCVGFDTVHYTLQKINQ